MKNLICGVLIFVGAAFLCGAEGIVDEAKKGNEKADMSYAFGMVVASDLKGTGLEFNYSSFTRGFRETLENAKTQYTQDEAMQKIQAAFQAAQAEIGQQNLVKGIAFLDENGKRPGVVTTDSGLQYEVISEGTGEMPAQNDSVLVDYKGTLIDGTVFDSTYENGGAVEIPLRGVIPGWAEGLRMMKEGGRAKLYIPPKLAYGERGAGNTIAPNSVLVFDVELKSIVRPAPGEAPEGAGNDGSPDE